MTNYPLADLVARLNNCKKETLVVPNTKDIKQFIVVLSELGMIKNLDYLMASYGINKKIQLSLNSNQPNKNIKISLLSTPGKRIYSSYKDLANFTYILRTSQGIISSQTALKNRIGGELLAKVEST